jgi:hypothetical protein
MSQLNKPAEPHPHVPALTAAKQRTLPALSRAEGPSLSNASERSILIATRAHSRQELSRCKQRMRTLSNRNKIQSATTPVCGCKRRAAKRVTASDASIGPGAASLEVLAK